MFYNYCFCVVCFCSYIGWCVFFCKKKKKTILSGEILETKLISNLEMIHSKNVSLVSNET